MQSRLDNPQYQQQQQQYVRNESPITQHHPVNQNTVQQSNLNQQSPFQEQQQPQTDIVILKVLRLSQPKFVPNKIPYLNIPFSSNQSNSSNELNNKLDDVFDQVLDRHVNIRNKDTNLVSSGNLTTFSELLEIPSSFGNIYIGEQFSSYVCINNDIKSNPIVGVGIRAELQSNSQKFVLIDTISPKPAYDEFGTETQQPNNELISLLPGQSADYLIKHEIKELGVHVLVCNLQYYNNNNSESPIYLRKLYKFQVLNPLAVKTKVNTTPEGDIFLEAQIKNVASESMYIERLRFDLNPAFEGEDLNVFLINETQFLEDVNNNENELDKEIDSLELQLVKGINDVKKAYEVSVFGNKYHFNTQDIRQYLFLLKPVTISGKENNSEEIKLKRKQQLVGLSSNALGKLDIVWRTHFGQLGRLQTSQLTRKIPYIDAFDIEIINIPKTVKVETPFTCIIRIKNNNYNNNNSNGNNNPNQEDQFQHLILGGEKSHMRTILLYGQGEYDVGRIPPLGFVNIEVVFFPLLRGLHRLTGLRLQDSITKKSKLIDRVIDVFVQ